MNIHVLPPRPAISKLPFDDKHPRIDYCLNRQRDWSERNPADHPPREWLYGRHYLKGSVSATVADGGTGKTTLVLTEAIAMATGRNLLGIEPFVHKQEVEAGEECDPSRPQRVLFWNGEEARDEIDRRVFAICQAHGIPLGKLEGQLDILSGIDDLPITIARMEHGTLVFDDELIKQLTEETLYDVMIFDPFVTTHRVPENDNMAIDAVVRKFKEIACGIRTIDRWGTSISSKAVELTHHARKPMSGDHGDRRVADARGASAFIDAVRAARVLNKMTETEATRADIGEADRWRYIRTDNGKANYAAPCDATPWYRLSSIILPNGDDVGVVTAWKFPGAFDNVTTAHMERVREMARTGQYRADARSPDWIGHAVAEVLDIDAETNAKRIKAILKTWYGTGALKKTSGKGRGRHDVTYVEPGEFEAS
jgi:hypothetical protein